jgi:phosphatidylserine decarboxylase
MLLPLLLLLLPLLLLLLLLLLLQGDEVAVFAYGGSIMATLFGGGAISFDDDLKAHSRAGKETLVTYASSLGRATGRPHAHAPAGQM